MSPELSDLIRRLRGLSRHEHDDASIGDEAADAIADLLDGYDSLCVQSQRDIAPGWVAVPECEWDQLMRQVFGE